MASISSMVEGPKSSEISAIEQINEETMKEFLTKCTVRDFHDTTKEDYMTKSDEEKKLLIINFYNYISSGINLLFVFLLFGILSEMSEMSRFSSLIQSWTVSSAMTRFSPVLYIDITLTLLLSGNLSDKFDSTSVGLSSSEL